MKPMPKSAYQHRKKAKLRYREPWYARPSCGGQAFPSPLCEKGGEVSGAVKEIEKKTVCTNLFLGFFRYSIVSCNELLGQLPRIPEDAPPAPRAPRGLPRDGPRAPGGRQSSTDFGRRPPAAVRWEQVAELLCPMPSTISFETGG